MRLGLLGPLELDGEPSPDLAPREENVLIVLGLFLVLAWRNAGWIGLDRWFIPLTHRALFARSSQTAT